MSARPTRPLPEQLARYAEEFNRADAIRLFGVRVSFPSMEKVRVDLDVRPEHLGGLGTTAVNGGVLAAIFDLVIGCTPALIDPTRRTATVQLSITFMRPVMGERIHAEAKVDSAGKSTIFSSARIFDEAGVACAKCDGVVRIGNIPWAQGQSPAVG